MAVIILKISPVISVCVQELAPAFHESERLIFYVKSVRHGGWAVLKTILFSEIFFLIVIFEFILVVYSKIFTRRHQIIV